MTQQLSINLDQPAYMAGMDEDQILAAAERILDRRLRHCGEPLTSPEVVERWLRVRLQERTCECFGVIWLDTRHRVIDHEELFFGTVDGAAVYPREVVRAALRHNAAACILYHNHPSGTAEPSSADHTLTERLKSALGMVDVRVLDHMIVGGDAVSSFAHQGQL